MTPPAHHPVDLGQLADFLLGELEPAIARSVEEHLFECPDCARRLAEIERIGRSVAAAVRGAAVGAVVSQAFVDRATRDGLSHREYRLRAGETVACSAGPEDLVVVRLVTGVGDVGGLEMEVRFEDLDHGQAVALPARDVVADRERGEVVLVLPGEVVRSYPRSTWTMSLRGESPDGIRDLGTFVMDHTP